MVNRMLLERNLLLNETNFLNHAKILLQYFSSFEIAHPCCIVERNCNLILFTNVTIRFCHSSTRCYLATASSAWQTPNQATTMASTAATNTGLPPPGLLAVASGQPLRPPKNKAQTEVKPIKDLVKPNKSSIRASSKVKTTNGQAAAGMFRPKTSMHTTRMMGIPTRSADQDLHPRIETPRTFKLPQVAVLIKGLEAT